MRTALVSPQLSRTSKALRTHSTLEGSLGLVQSPVIAKVPRIRKLFAAVPTSVVLITCVCNPDMLLHIVKPRESLATVWTEDATLVHAAMIGILPPGVHLLTTQLTAIQYLSSMQSFVLRQISAD